MLKNRKRGILILLVMLCITLACFVGCGSIEVPDESGVPGIVTLPDDPNNPNNPNNPNDPNNPNNPNNTDTEKLDAVDKSSVTCTKEDSSFWVSWEGVTNAQSYLVKCGSASLKTTTTRVDLTTASEFTMPSSGTIITVTIIAKGDGYIDSSPVTITYEEGKKVSSPEIISFENGIITWKREPEVQSYTVKIDGKTAAESTSATYDTATLDKDAQIDIIAANANSSATTSVMYKAASGKLSVMPITDYTLDGDILKWEAVDGVKGYKVVDLDFNSYVVTTTHYIMSIRNVIYGVYPVMPADSVVESAEVEQTDIKYLEGSGTTSDPYLIKTPFDLRTVDYYELKEAENGNKKKNNYKIVNDINYNAVSALESDSNMFTLRKPFFGVLDGDGKTLSNIRVNYKNGFWAMFEYIAKNGTVKNIKFDRVEINNGVRDNTHPINPATAMVAYRNYGTVSGVTLSDATFNVTAGNAAGIVIHNYGTVSGCNINKCNLMEKSTSSMGAAAYEMAGVVLENLKGGTVSGNNVTTLTISGASSSNRNVGSSAGIVAINRAGATVKDNSFNGVTIKNIKSLKEAGGVVGYCAAGGTVTKGTGDLGTLIVDSSTVSAEMGSSSAPHGKLCGKKDQ